MAWRNSKSDSDVYDEVTARMLEVLDEGIIPWQRLGAPTPQGSELPRSMPNGKCYRGVNVLLLAIAQWRRGYESSLWLTFNQAKEMRRRIHPGEKGSLVVLWNELAGTSPDASEGKRRLYLRRGHVFNVAQVTGAPPLVDASSPAEAYAKADAIVANYQAGPMIDHIGTGAEYLPAEDRVRIGSPESFQDRETYYAALFRALVYSSGHPQRLHRSLDDDTRRSDFDEYSKERLVAELGGAFLAASVGLCSSSSASAATDAANWRHRFAADRTLTVQAARLAQRAADFIRNATFTSPTHEA